MQSGRGVGRKKMARPEEEMMIQMPAKRQTAEPSN